VVAAVLGFIVAFVWSEETIAFLRFPLDQVVRKYPATRLVQTTVGEGFLAAMKVSVFAGLVLAGPYILHQLWAFVGAGLYVHERRSLKYYAAPGFLLFFAGAALAYFLVLPWALDFLIGFAVEETGLENLLSLGPYVSLVAWSMFIFGLIFQLPLVMVFLMRLGVVEPDTFRRYRRHAIVVNFIVGAVLTPPDVITQCALAGSLILLYEAAIVVGARVARKRRTEA
jgi:sec-independent protein translocase protein TatC